MLWGNPQLRLLHLPSDPTAAEGWMAGWVQVTWTRPFFSEGHLPYVKADHVCNGRLWRPPYLPDHR
jgi:hypothetical protein